MVRHQGALISQKESLSILAFQGHLKRVEILLAESKSKSSLKKTYDEKVTSVKKMVPGSMESPSCRILNSSPTQQLLNSSKSCKSCAYQAPPRPQLFPWYQHTSI